MKTKAKRISLALTMVTAFAVAVGLLWRKEPPQIIALPNGEQYQFVKAEWGTNEVQPTVAVRLVDRLPDSLADFIVRKWGSRLGIVTAVGSRKRWRFHIGPLPPFPPPPPEPSLHFWFRSVGTNLATRPIPIKFMLADKDGVLGGKGNGTLIRHGQGTNEWLTFALPIVPRRSDTLQLYLFQAGDPFNGPFRQIGTMPFRNPLFGHFPNLQHEPVPMTKVEGDLQVRLMDFTVAAAKSGTSVNGTLIPFHRPGAGEDHEIVFKLDTYSPRGTNETWIIQPAELSDTTGNRVRSDNPLHFPVTDEYRFGPALWPNETGWRLKLTLKRSRGYNPEELVTFTNVPVPTLGPTNAVFVTNRIHGMPVALTVWQPTAQETAITVELPDKPAGKAVDFVELSADAGRKLTGYSVSRSDYWSANLVSSIPSNVKTVNITWAVQKTHTVEFLVKPPKAE